MRKLPHPNTSSRLAIELFCVTVTLSLSLSFAVAI